MAEFCFFDASFSATARPRQWAWLNQLKFLTFCILASGAVGSTAPAQSRGPLGMFDGSRDFLTQRARPSKLTDVYLTMLALKQNEIDFAQAQRVLRVLGVDLDVESTRNKEVLEETFRRRPAPPGYRSVGPIAIGTTYSLFVKNDEVLRDVFETLLNRAPLGDLLVAMNVHRLTFSPAGTTSRFFVVPASGATQDAASHEEVGLLVLQDSRGRETASNADLDLFEPQQAAVFGNYVSQAGGQAYEQVTRVFFNRLNWKLDGVSGEDARTLPFRHLGFPGAASVLNSETSAVHSRELLAILAAMGYQIDPSSPGSGYASYVEDDERREKMQKLIFQTTLVPEKPTGSPSPPMSSRAWENMKRVYSEIAAALYLYGESGLPLPQSKEWDVFSLEEAPYLVSAAFTEAVFYAKHRFPSRFGDVLKLGREKRWNFQAPSASSCGGIFKRKGGGRRRL